MRRLRQSRASNAFKTAYIKVARDTGQDNPSTPWSYDFGDQLVDTAAIVNYFLGQFGQRGTRTHEKPKYHVAYVCGIYELINAADNDPNSESANVGITFHANDANGEPEFSVIPQEVLRDVAAQWGWSTSQKNLVHQALSLHEIGHQFNLVHNNNLDSNGNPTDVMWTPDTETQEDKFKNMPLKYSKADLAKIRNVTSP